MNYLDQINVFWLLDAEIQFNGNETRLYFYLLKQSNSLYWKNPITNADGHLAGQVGISVNTLKTVRNKLQQAGLIGFKAGGNGARDKSSYTIVSANDLKIRYQILTPNPPPYVTPNVPPYQQKTDDIYKQKHTPSSPPGGAAPLLSPEDWLIEYFDTPAYAKARELVSYVFKVPLEKLRLYGQEFVTELIQDNVQVKGDFPPHFRNWLRLKLEREQEQQTNTHATTGNTKQAGNTTGKTKGGATISELDALKYSGPGNTDQRTDFTPHEDA